MRQFRVAAVQMASGASVAANLEAAGAHIADAARQGARLVMLPEFFALMGKQETDILEAREVPGTGPIQSFLSEQARRHRAWLVGGTIPLACEAPGKVRAACLLLDDRGEVVARYDKMHLFDVTVPGDSRRIYRESRTVDAGSELVAVDTPFGRLGLAVCYDLRFPELFRALAQRGMDVLALPSAFTEVTGRAHWETLVRARAIENLCYVVAPAQGGLHASGRETHGDTMVVDPWGTVLGRLAKGPGVVVCEVDRDHASSIRRNLPSLTHMKLGVTLNGRSEMDYPRDPVLEALR
jgi:nitrilase